jgi:cytochrome c553
MRNVFTASLAILLLTILLLTGSAFGNPLVDGNAEAGKAKAITCGACHGVDGNSVNPVWPSIAGQHPTYIIDQLKAFKGDATNNIPPSRNEPLMLGQVMMLGDDDMKNVAVYFSEMPAAVKSVADPSSVDRGQRIFRGGDRASGTPACNACHGPTGRGNPAASVPSLKGQYAIYTAAQLRAYASGTRQSDGPTRVMRDIASRLSEEDIVAVASYVQGLQ